MSFDSIFFLCCFLPLTLGLYYLVPGSRWKQSLLLVMGLVFYAFGSLTGVVLLLLAVGFNYLVGLALQKAQHRKAILIFGVSVNLLYLAVFKYLNFLFTQMLGLPAVELGLAAPLGMSFFLFKSISYLIDTYRDTQTGTKNLFRFSLYLSFFSQVTAGPITRFAQFAWEPQNANLQAVAEGLRRFVVGLAKKALICTVLGPVVDAIFALNQVDIRLAWLGALAYMLQIYFDFSGYSDMAIGLGKMLGYGTPENFRFPYQAYSIGDFWRRWHISLSSWFRDYLYIPLGGNRKGNLRAAWNKVVVFTLCGLWHGASWTFLLWGLWHGLFSALESLRLIRPDRLQKSKPGKLVAHIYTLLVVCLGFVMFRAGSVQQGLDMIGAMFAGFCFRDAGTVLLYQLCNWETIVVLVIGCVLALPVKQYAENWKVFRRAGEPLSYLVCLLLLLLCLLKLAAGGFAPFIYAQF